MSDKALAEFVGVFVKHHRLAQNRTQAQLATAAGLSRSTLSLLERGETVTVATLIQVLRVLDRLEVFGAFEVKTQVSPLALARLQKAKRQRAGRVAKQIGETREPTDW